MAKQTQIQKQGEGGSPLVAIRNYLDDEKIQSSLQNMLGENASVFRTSVINLMSASPTLLKCTQGSLRQSIMTAAAVKLPIDPVLGMAAIVPYRIGKDQYIAQFQLMYRGVIQLCIRSGQYKHINCTEVYEDEIDFYNPITGEVSFKDPKEYQIRYQENRDEHVAGHYIYFELLTGFKHSGYISCREAIAHAKRYSKAYQYDLKEKKANSAWSTNPIEMGNKTIILRELKRYGIMSIDLQKAIVQDNSYEIAEAQAQDYIDADMGSEPVDAEFESEPEDDQAKKEEKPNKKTRKKAPKEAPAPEPEPEPNVDNETGEVRTSFVCKSRKCGKPFEEPGQKQSTNGPIYCCPHCGSLGYESLEPGEEAA